MDNRSFMDTTYKGYQVKINPLNGMIWIERSGMRIAYANSRHEALLTIDSLSD